MGLVVTASIINQCSKPPAASNTHSLALMEHPPEEEPFCELDCISAKKPPCLHEFCSPLRDASAAMLASASKRIDFGGSPDRMDCESSHRKQLTVCRPGKLLTGFRLIPSDSWFKVLTFLDDREILFKAQLVSGFFRKLVSQGAALWSFIIRERKALTEIGLRYQKLRVLSTTKSKGQTIVAQDRVTREQFVIKVLDLEVANGGFNNGMPTSVARELAGLPTLCSPFVNR